MNLRCTSAQLADYLLESEVVNYRHPLIQAKAKQLAASNMGEVDQVKATFEYVRDEIKHSWDIQSARVTCIASDVLRWREGICYAKAHLLATLLRAQGIPTGFCYQKLTLGDTPETGYCLHALNAVYLKSLGKWLRLDARGNKPGVNAQFSIYSEKSAFPIRPEHGEMDEGWIHCEPHPATVKALSEGTNALDIYRFGLPIDL
ncbi:transglutaminase-like domain-containing protein [Laceyella putida]|uniref:Transglutaminase family protein n=1 Tax=Laceyella putida TaxID=110101 RepID=A0ABW2RIP2_9BACL